MNRINSLEDVMKLAGERKAIVLPNKKWCAASFVSRMPLNKVSVLITRGIFVYEKKKPKTPKWIKTTSSKK